MIRYRQAAPSFERLGLADDDAKSPRNVISR